MRVLLVEPNDVVATALEDALLALAEVSRRACFESARKQLATGPFDFIVTNLRLAAFNGLHLIYLATSVTSSVRGIVYTESLEPALAREVQRAGAFYDTAERLPITLAAYLTSALPPRDRRDAAVPDRRTRFRGGRRIWDEHLLGRPA